MSPARTIRAMLVSAALAAGGMLALPAGASAFIVEIGRTVERNPPTCPDNCQAVSRTTGFQTQVNQVSHPHIVPRNGRIAAVTLTLGRPNEEQLEFFSDTIAQRAIVRVAIIRPAARVNNRFRFFLNAQSEPIELNRYFGRTVQFPLRTTLWARRGYVVALTVQTWAPVLAAGLTRDYSWRASRGKPCADTLDPAIHSRPGSIIQYFCHYRTARLTYTATLITHPDVVR